MGEEGGGEGVYYWGGGVLDGRGGEGRNAYMMERRGAEEVR